jgi:transposase-like protein
VRDNREVDDFPAHCLREDEATRYMEALRWPSGPVCPHCTSPRKAYALESKPESTNQVRKGVYKCCGCRKKFTVTVGTIFEDSRVPLYKWLLAAHLMCVSPEGITAAELQRKLGLKSYRSALFMSYRIEWAAEQSPFAGELKALRSKNRNHNRKRGRF